MVKDAASTPPKGAVIACVHVLVAQSRSTFCNPMNCRSGSSVHGILQAKIWEWVITPLSQGSSLPRD